MSKITNDVLVERMENIKQSIDEIKEHLAKMNGGIAETKLKSLDNAHAIEQHLSNHKTFYVILTTIFVIIQLLMKYLNI